MEVICKKNIPDEFMSKKFAQDFMKEFLSETPNFTVFFEGELGVGKTFIIKEMLWSIGISNEIPSPTYTLVNEYRCPEKRQFAHFDFYRLKPEDFYSRGLHEVAEDLETSSFVEWPERLPEGTRGSFTGQKFVIRLEHGDDGVGRKVKVLKG